jgi:hypothetical protein
MSWFDRLIAVFRSQGLDAELNEELQFHLDSRIRNGMSPAEARRALGGYDRSIEASRDADRFRWLENIGRDLRYALRALRASPVFTLTAVLSLALGIGANTAVFTLLRASLWRPLPASHPEQIVQGFGSVEANLMAATPTCLPQLRETAACRRYRCHSGFGRCRSARTARPASASSARLCPGITRIGHQPGARQADRRRGRQPQRGNPVVVVSHRF